MAMKTLVIDGVEFLKASEAAKQFGYTSDYVGQLCRGGKVAAQLVGRSWYVNIDSLTTHRKARYRSSQKKTKEALKEVKQAQHQHTDVETPEAQPNFYERLQTHHVRYEPDDGDLLPQPRKQRTEHPHEEHVAQPVKHLAIESDSEAETDKAPAAKKAQTEQKEPVPEEREIPVIESTEEPGDYYIEVAHEEAPRRGKIKIVTEEEAETDDDMPKTTLDPEEEPRKRAPAAPAPAAAPSRPYRPLMQNSGPRRSMKQAGAPQRTAAPEEVRADTNPAPKETTPFLAISPVAVALVAGLLVAGAMTTLSWQFQQGESGPSEAGYRIHITALTSLFNIEK